MDIEHTGDVIAAIRATKEESFINDGPASRARISKRLKHLFDVLVERKKDFSPGIALGLAREMVDWAKAQNKTYLRINLEVRLAKLLLDEGSTHEALDLITALIRELKKMDDKLLLVEVHLMESQAFHLLMNVPKAKAALTSARAIANTIYCAPDLQAKLDLHSGILMVEEGDYRTASSFFYEAVEVKPDFRAIAGKALNYYLLTLLVMEKIPEIEEIAAGTGSWKTGISTAKEFPKIVGELHSLARAVRERSLASFETSLGQLETMDKWSQGHLKSLGSKLLQRNLQAIIAPYSRVQISFLAEKLELPLDVVLDRLSQMILDGMLYGLIDQESDTLQMLDTHSQDEMYEALQLAVENMTRAVDVLGRKAALLRTNQQ